MGIMQSVFGDEPTPTTRRIRLGRVHLTFQAEQVREEFPAYLSSARFTDPAAIYELFRDLRHETREHFLALHLDGKNRIICFDLVSVGSLNQCIVHPREVFMPAVASAGEIVGIKVLDHIIVGDETFTSFVSQGLM